MESNLLFNIDRNIILKSDWDQWEETIKNKMKEELDEWSKIFAEKHLKTKEKITEIEQNKNDIIKSCTIEKKDPTEFLNAPAYAYNKTYILYELYKLENKYRQHYLKVMYDQLLNEFVKLKTNVVGNSVDNNQLIDQNVPMDISTKFNINDSVICRKKRKCVTIEPIKKVNTVSYTKSKCDILHQGLQKYDCYIEIGFQIISFARTCKEFAVNAFHDEIIITLKDQNDNEKKISFEAAKNNSMELTCIKDNLMTKYFLRLLIVGIEESIKRKKKDKRMNILVGGLRKCDITLLTQIENGTTLEKNLDNDEITILAKYMKYSNSACKIAFLENCTSTYIRKIAKNACYQITLNKNNYSKESYAYDDIECSSDEEL
uniref:MADF domain-containing protein n=1 Tax=Strongyloides papillosus TaxID=174720 RepID=A0A0N5C0A0_STREA